jgi:hypothetical protein
MRTKRVYLVLAFGLAILLGIQLTGLPCLQDTTLAQPGLFDQDASSPEVYNNQGGVDGCPCHLHFVSIMGDPPQLESTVSPLAPSTLSSHVSLHALSLFRPPATV